MAEPEAFSISAAFWLPSRGPYTFEEFVPGEAERVLETLSVAGLPEIDLLLPWSSFQPIDARVPVAPMRHVEFLLDLAASLGMRASISLPRFVIGWDIWAPGWALDVGEVGERRVVRGHLVDRTRPRGILTDGAVRTALLRLTREIAGAFHGHPAVRRWCLSDQLLAASGPVSAAEMQEWVPAQVDELRQAGARDHVSVGLSRVDLIRNPAASFKPSGSDPMELDVLLEGPPSGEDRDSVEWYAFLSAYATSLAGAPARLTGVGQSSDVSTDAILKGALQGGAAGVSAWSAAAADLSLRNAPPFDRRPELLDTGILDRHGQITASGGALLEVARDAPPIQPPPPDFPQVDPELRERDPRGTSREYFEEWTR